MRVPSRTMSRPNRIVCPACGSGRLQLQGLEPARCDSCGFSVEDAMFRTLEQIAALPDALGAHACECDHPEMRRLPDGVFHCPACRSEVIPLRTRRSLPGNPARGLGSAAVPLPSDANVS